MISSDDELVFELSAARLRRWRWGDQAALIRHADDRAVWLNLRNSFPHPYTVADAESWLRRIVGVTPATNFAIEVDGEAAGSVGLTLQADVYGGCAEIGYWLGRAHWGRQIGTEAARVMTEYAFEVLDQRRVYADVFGWNAASARVLEKAGYELEGRARGAILKDGEITDALHYGLLRTQWESLTGRAPR